MCRDAAGSADNPRMVCEKCGTIYCFVHSASHDFPDGAKRPKRACAAYEKAQREAEYLSLLAIANCTKKCPKCKVDTQKASGCNHMTCRECRTDWCWICGRRFRSTDWHYNMFNPFGCPGDDGCYFLDRGHTLYICVSVLHLPR